MLAKQSLLLASLAMLSAGLGCAGSYRLDDPAAFEEAPRNVIKLRWQRRLVEQGFLSYRPQEWARAAVSPEGVIFVGSSSRRYHAFVGTTGRVLWTFDTEGAVSSASLYHQPSKTVFFGADNGKMYAVEARTGKLKWVYATQGTIRPRPTYSDGLLLFSTNEGRIYALDAGTGKWRWQYDREAPEGFTIQGYSGVAVAGLTAYAGFSDGYLVALRTTTGDVVWTRSLKGGKIKFVDVDSTPIFINGLLLTSSYSSGVFAISPENGSIIWNYPVEGASEIAVARDKIYFTAPKTGLVALDREGRQLWRQAISAGVPSRPIISDPYIFVSSTEAGLYVASSETGRLLSYFNTGYGISAVSEVVGNMLVVLANQGTLYAFQVLRPVL